MSKTANIHLNLTEDENTSFANWRKSIDGNNDSENKSNMQIIDEEIGDHETRITTLESAGGGGVEMITPTKDSLGRFVLTAEEVNKILAQPFNYVLKIVDPQMSVYVYLPLNYISVNDYTFANIVLNNKLSSSTTINISSLVFTLVANKSATSSSYTRKQITLNN